MRVAPPNSRESWSRIDYDVYERMEETVMGDEADQTRRWLINASGAAILSSTLPATGPSAQAAPAPTPGAAAHAAGEPTSSAAATLADYVAKTPDRDLPAEVVARVKLHVLDTFAAIVSGSRLKAGE